MKVAIMTQPLGKNYGGMMQAWALQRILIESGHEPITIDRKRSKPNAAYSFARLFYRLSLKATGRSKALINGERYIEQLLKNTQSFIDEYINISEPLYSTKDLKNHFKHNKYDAVIVGSDQTWRPSYSPNIYNFFLDFLDRIDIPRIAYATSFGVDFLEFNAEQRERCAKLAARFNAIGVREKSGVSILEEHFNVKSTHVLDPTLLVSRAEYENLLVDFRQDKLEGIYTYFLDKTPEKLAFALNASHQMQEPVISYQAKESLNNIHKAEFEDLVMPDPRKWLSGFMNSKYVITDSFHGMVFAIIFGKPFYAIKNASRGSARFDTLSEAFNCKDSVLLTSQLDAPFPPFKPLANELNYQDSPFVLFSKQWLKSQLA